MTSLKFPQANIEIAKDQDEYNNLHAYVQARTEGTEGYVIFCWGLTWRERIVLLLTGRLWHTVLTFHTPLQPQRVTTSTPFDNAQ